MTYAATLVREACLVAVAQRVSSAMVVATLVAMCAGILLTTGRAEGARAELLADIDQVGTRTIQVRAEPGAGLRPDVVDRLAAVRGIDWVGAFGPSIDVTSVAASRRGPVSLRFVVTRDDDVGQVAADAPGRGEPRATATASATEILGLAQGTGAVSSADGRVFVVAGTVPDRQELAALGPVLLVPPRRPGDIEEVSTLVVVSATPDLVGPLASTLGPLLAVDDPSRVTIETSEQLASIRAQVDQGLGVFGRTLLLVVFSFTALLVSAILFGTVLMRRKDFGRRRALGASQHFVAHLVLVQTTLLGALGITAGVVISVGTMLVLGDPVPRASFLLALAVLVLALAVLSSVFPAIFASRRDPLRELRVA